MAGNSIASGAATITASADQLAVGLAHAKNRVENFGNETTKKLASTGQSGGRAFAKNLGADFAQEIGRRSFVGGVIGGFAGGGLAGGVSEIIANTIGGIADPLSSWLSGMHSVREQGELIARMIGMIEKSIERSTKLTAEWRGAMVSQADIVSSLDTDLDQIRSTVQAMQADWKNAADAAKEAGEVSVMGFARFVMRKDAEFLQGVTKNANDQSTAIAKLVQKYRELELQKERALDPRKDPAKMGQITKALAQMNDELVKFGRDDVESKLFDLEKLGANTAELESARDMLVSIREKKAQLAADEEARKMMAKNPPPWMAMALNFAGEIAKTFEDMGDNGMRFAGALEKGSREAYSLVVRSQSEASGMEMDKTAAAVKQLKTPLERAAERLDQINRKFAEIEDV